MTGVPSFITTLGMLFFLNGVTLTISDGFPKPAPTAGSPRWIGGADFSGFWWAVGIDRDLARPADEHPLGRVHGGHGRQSDRRQRGRGADKRIKVGNFMLAAVAGFAGISEGIRVHTFLTRSPAAPTMFLGVAAAVIGGTALAGGSGTMIGAFLGAIFLGMLRDGLTIKGISAQHLQHDPRHRDHRLDDPQRRANRLRLG